VANGKSLLIIFAAFLISTVSVEARSQEIPPQKIFTPESAIKVDLKYRDTSLGTIEGYSNNGSFLVPLGVIASKLKFNITIDAPNATASGWFLSPSRIFVLHVNTGQAIIEGKEVKIPPNTAFINKGEIYVDIALLESFFPLNLRIDTNQGYLQILPNEPFPGLEETSPTEKTLPAKPVPLQAAPSEQPSTQPAKPVQEKEQLDALNEDNLVIFQTMLDKIALENFIEGYSTENQNYLISFSDLMHLLDFPITFDPLTNTAKGWFVKEENTFLLNVKEGFAEIKGQRTSFPKAQVRIKDGMLFVNSELLARWFPLEFKFDLASLIMHINPTEPLPIMTKMEREKKLEKFQKQQQKQAVVYDRIEAPYQGISFPFLDLDLNTGFTHNANSANNLTTSLTNNNFITNTGTTVPIVPVTSGNTAPNKGSFYGYSVVGGGDLAYLSANTYVAGNNDRNPEIARLDLGRKDADAQLLGPMHATAFDVGDINSGSVPLVATTSLGRGVSVTNLPVNSNLEFDHVSLVGDSIADWDVELYRNDALIDFQHVGTDGRYQFINVPLLYGNNIFRLVFYGPQGQTREETRQYNIGDEVLHPGEFRYFASVDQKSQSLFGLNEDFGVQNTKDVRYVSDFQFGLTKWLTGVVGAVSTPLIDGVHNYLTSGLRADMLGSIIGFDGAVTDNNQWATKTTLVTAIKDVSLKLEQRFYSDNYTSEENVLTGATPTSLSQIDLNTSFPSFLFLPYMTMGLNVKNETFPTGDQQFITHRFTTSISGIGISNNLTATYSPGLDTYIGDFALRGNLFGWNIHNVLEYELQPLEQLQKIDLVLQHNITQNVSDRIEIQKDLVESSASTYLNSIIWDRQLYKISLETSVSERGDAQILGRLTFSLAKDPRSNDVRTTSQSLASKGGVVAKTYLDTNNNQKLDDGDQLITEPLGYNVGGKKYTANNDAEDLILGVDTYRPVNIEIDQSQIPDPRWVPYKNGYTVITHPGAAPEVDFLLTATSDIDGIVYVNGVGEGGQPFEVPLEGSTVELVNDDGKVIATQRSEFDGFFDFEKVFTGHYVLRIKASELEEKKLAERETQEITVTNKSDSYSGKDIHLIRADVPAGNKTGGGNINYPVNPGITE